MGAGMDELSIREIHLLCINMLEQVIERLGWINVSVNELTCDQKQELTFGIANSILNWKWAMSRYKDNVVDSVFGLSLRDNELNIPNALHAVILYKYDRRRRQFCVCMLQNFFQHKETALSGKILIIALIYSTWFCEIVGLNDIYIQDPTPEARPHYAAYSFAQVWHDLDKMSADVTEVLQLLRAKSTTLRLII